eukprot:CAMPEP_0119005688 /NCGR_PEP_ID=MMETSP1176-20130426/1869_1 /TAXON_ID=265551 /ORGANISM="Synedropsis recta cf, Strain CCMP1620" /LENGTH=154 /DNA_ID=CAMNT_0006957525 /DNA_START=55 /DNA_END=516 /DNA_ORIENTATION=+
MAPFLNAAALASKFPSLFSISSNSKPLTALYFSASWCPDCNIPTPILKQVHASTCGDWNVVYVASDSNDAQVQAFVGDSTFQQIPYQNVDERSNLKRHFGACAAKEVDLLGMTPAERKFGVPTLIVLETATGRIISTDGVTEIMTQKEGAVEQW